MSMLAERRQKQRWSLNPRGKLWLEDKNAFGQKMLEKMGWKHGKGLGANEDGCTESLHVTYKNDNKGMGYKEIEGWTSHEDDFSSLLKTLNQNNVEESENTKITSLEKKVQNSRARINYHKFTKAKDLSQYSEKDLANIFGKKSLKQTPNVEEKPFENVQTDNHNPLLMNKGSMLDYFKKKLPNFGKSSLEKDESDCENARIGFGFAQDHNENHKKKKRSYTDTLSSNEGSSDEPSKKKKVKTSNANETFVSYLYQDDYRVNQVDENEEKSPLEGEGRKKKKSKQKNKEDTNNVEENQNPAQEEHKEKKSKSNIEDFHDDKQTNDISIDVNSKSKKKKQKNLNLTERNETGIENQITCNESIQNDEEQPSIDKKQKKSKKKHKESVHLGISNAAFCDFNNSELKEVENQTLVEENCDQDRKTRKPKKVRVNDELSSNIVEAHGIEKKKSKKDKENQVNHEGEHEICKSEQATKKQKKSKKHKTTENYNCGISNPAFCENNVNASNDYNDTSQEVSDNETPKRKKKKKRKNKDIENGIDNPTFNSASDSPDTTTQEPEDICQKESKRHKKSSEEHNLGLDNPGLNLDDIILDSDLMLNVVSTPTILKKPSIEKVALNSKIERIKSVRRKSVRFSNVLQERIIPNDPTERANEYISQRNELFDINTMVIEEGIKEEMEKNGMKYERGPQISHIEDPEELNQLVVESSVKEELNRGLNPQAGFINNAFDIRSVDKIDFYNEKYEVKTSPSINGIDNRCFNKLQTQIDENIEDISNTIDRYQAEVENDINESKDTQSTRQQSEKWLVGEVGSQINRNIRINRATKLCFREMHFKTPIPHYLNGENISRAKKSYRHLIRGDITLAFKDSNLHVIKGYAAQNVEGQVNR